MFIHMLPNMASHILVTATVRIPMMIIAESSLSFLGLGIKPPMTSWGLLLSQANKIQVLRLYPWMLIPGFFIVLSVLCYNFMGDGLRDVIDPYAT
jgi:peptide/nickel transport system permease protein